ncbi:DUF1801 domain-containing protein [uncultured Shimia sp.]|uniref:DUF1801 domain-containing protein n=1 Tax=uncultured Shimia sp. TaxID=573152 RepID=UPI0026355A9E|nr:DUF1801 domain-containing protein [uncultured Shimia sp.]
MTIEQYFTTVPEGARDQLESLRDIIRAAAEATDTAPLEESLKWGQPSFAPSKRMGTPIRLSWSHKSPERAEMLVHCQTTLVDAWRHRFGDLFDYDGTRAVHIDLAAHLPEEALHIMAVMALTYHKTKG